MKKILSLCTILSIFILSLPYSYAGEEDVNRSDVFQFFAKQYQENVPESFQYINLMYTDIQKDTKLEDALQLLVYLDLIKNTPAHVFPQKKISIYTFEKLTKKITDVQINAAKTKKEKQNTFVTQQDLSDLYGLLNNEIKQNNPVKIIIRSNDTEKTLTTKERIFKDVYKTLTQSHYDRKKITDDQLMQGAIEGLTKGTGDRYTRYFPPVDSSDFFQILEGEYEGIGAYVDMPSPGELVIVSPMVGSPAESSGLKGGDIITHVNGKEIKKTNSLKQVVSWIKGPAGSVVKLKVQREGLIKDLEIEVTRGKIVLKDVEYKKLDSKTFYIQIKSFGDHAEADFKEALGVLMSDSKINKIIFDLRNNPGGYLSEVSNMLSYFIKKGSPTAIVDSGTKELKYQSLGLEGPNLSQYKVIFLQNKGTASASEIMIGTIKDYFPKVTIIGEQSFGKGSVQTIKKYFDGSSIKYTSAKWFTGKTKNGIDGVGITPDIELELDEERLKELKKDNQLEKAIRY